MKKLFSICILALTLAACNNGADSDESVKDSVLESIDSLGDAREDSIERATDSLESKVENTFEKTDDANRAIADSMEKRK